MPYKSVSELPSAQTRKYNAHQKRAFMHAFNDAYAKYGEERAFKIAHTAAQHARPKLKRRS